jgi:hypothetical protein
MAPRLLEILPLSAMRGCVDSAFAAEKGQGVRRKASPSEKDSSSSTREGVIRRQESRPECAQE